jgi:DNA polymerase III subunit beta
MDFQITREELLQGLYLTQGIVERRTTIPILSNALIEATSGGISIAATDQEIGVRRRCDAKVKKNGSLTTGARKLYEIARECPDGTITIRALENNWIEVVAGKSRFKIVGLDAADFPRMPTAATGKDVDTTIVPSATLREMIGRTIFAVSNDDARLNLSGLFFERPEPGKIRVVSTDGHRLSMITRQVDSAVTSPGVIIPRKGVNEINKVLESGDEPVTLQFSPGVVHMSRGPVDLSMRLIEGEFPDYKQVVPQRSAHRMLASVSELLAAVRRVSTVSSERTHGIKVTLNGNHLELSSVNPDLGEATEELAVDYDGAALGIGFNANYLLDVLGVLGDVQQVEMGLNDEVSPGVIRAEGDPDFLYVVMPMRM